MSGKVNNKLMNEENKKEKDISHLTLRDAFASAALVGLLSSGKYSVWNATETAYEAADRMMMERTRHFGQSQEK